MTRDKTGTSRDRQRQIGTKQGQQGQNRYIRDKTGTIRDQKGTFRDKTETEGTKQGQQGQQVQQGQAGTFMRNVRKPIVLDYL